VNREQTLESLLVRQWTRTEEESARLAQLLHDGVAQQAAALQIGLAALRARLGAEFRSIGDLDQLVILSGELAQSILEVTSQIHPPVLESLGLEAAVQWWANRSQLLLGIPVQCYVERVRVRPQQAVVLLRILENALENVARHARATRADIRLEQRGGEVSLSITDSGQGFHPKRLRSQLGLSEMQERAALAGGAVEIASKPGQGTSIVVTMPAANGIDPADHGHPSAIQVLIADDHPIVRRGLKQILSERNGVKVDEVDSFPALRHYLSRRIPDVLVLDINMPGGNGIEMLGELSRLYPQVPVLVLSVHPEEQAGVRAVASGAKGYLTKDAAPEKLAEAVRTLHRKGRYINPRLADAMAEYVRTPRSDLAPHHQLSARELTVLLLIASGRPTGAIAQQMNISPKTVSTYRTRIFEKMRIKSAAELTRYVIEHNLAEDRSSPSAPPSSSSDPPEES
jgi:two-component system, NarL family, invasion response regulator UvrY